MTDDSKHIIKEYQEGDFEKRLCLFLQHRALRNEFIQIERCDKKPEFQEQYSRNKPGWLTFWGVFKWPAKRKNMADTHKFPA